MIERSEFMVRAYNNLYEKIFLFVKKFMLSKNPSTIVWLMEILLIITTKFKPDDVKRIKTDFATVLDTLLKSTASVLTDSFGLTFTQTYGIH